MVRKKRHGGRGWNQLGYHAPSSRCMLRHRCAFPLSECVRTRETHPLVCACTCIDESTRNVLFRLRRFECKMCLSACKIKILMIETFFLASLSLTHTPKAACCSVSVVVYCWFKVRHDITGSENPSRRRLPDFRSGLPSPCPCRSRLSHLCLNAVTSRESGDCPF